MTDNRCAYVAKRYEATIADLRSQLEATQRALHICSEDKLRLLDELEEAEAGWGNCAETMTAERTRRKEAERIVDQFRRSGLGEEIRRADEAERRLAEALAALENIWTEASLPPYRPDDGGYPARIKRIERWAGAVLASQRDESDGEVH